MNLTLGLSSALMIMLICNFALINGQPFDMMDQHYILTNSNSNKQKSPRGRNFGLEVESNEEIPIMSGRSFYGILNSEDSYIRESNNIWELPQNLIEIPNLIVQIPVQFLEASNKILEIVDNVFSPHDLIQIATVPVIEMGSKQVVDINEKITQNPSQNVDFNSNQVVDHLKGRSLNKNNEIKATPHRNRGPNSQHFDYEIKFNEENPDVSGRSFFGIFNGKDSNVKKNNNFMNLAESLFEIPNLILKLPVKLLESSNKILKIVDNILRPNDMLQVASVPVIEFGNKQVVKQNKEDPNKNKVPKEFDDQPSANSQNKKDFNEAEPVTESVPTQASSPNENDVNEEAETVTESVPTQASSPNENDGNEEAEPVTESVPPAAEETE